MKLCDVRRNNSNNIKKYILKNPLGLPFIYTEHISRMPFHVKHAQLR